MMGRLGELAGFSRATTNTAIAKLRKLDLVRTEYGGILVLDVDRLRAFVQSVGMEDHLPEKK